MEERAPKREGVAKVFLWIRWILTQIPANLRSSVTVALVNIPLSIALSIACGGTPVAGIVTAFWAGSMSAIFGGSEFNITGTTGALAGVLTPAAAKHSPAILQWVAIWSAVFSLIVWRFKLVDYLLFVPNSVVQGFTVGVAMIIVIGQYDNALGLTFKHTHPEPYMKLAESVYYTPSMINYETFLFFLANFVALLFLTPRFPQVPWSVVLTLLGVIIGMTNSHPGDFFNSLVTLEQKYGDLKLQLFTLPTVSADVFEKDVIYSSMAVAFIAVLETLISARLADEMTKTHHDRQREVLGVSLANLASGLFGGIPATAALARTSLNVKSGAVSRISGITSGVWLYLLAYVLIPYFEFVPMASVAGILGVLACRLIETEALKLLWKNDKWGVAICALTAVLCVLEDTMTALLVGSLLSVGVYVNSCARGYAEMGLYNRGLLTALTKAQGQGVGPYQTGPTAPQVFSSVQTLSSEMTLIARVDVNTLDGVYLPVLLDSLIDKYEVEVDGATAAAAPQVVTTRTSAAGSGVTITMSDAALLPTYNSVVSPVVTNASSGIPPRVVLPLEDVPSDDVQTTCDVLEQCEVLFYRFAGQLTYVNALSHTSRNSKVIEVGFGPSIHSCVLAVDAVWLMDLDGVIALHEIIEEYQRAGLTVYLAGVQQLGTSAAFRDAHSTYADRSQRASVSDMKVRGTGSFTSFYGVYGVKERRMIMEPGVVKAHAGESNPDNLPLASDTAGMTVSRLLTNQDFYQKLLRDGRVFSCCDSAMQAALRKKVT